MAANARAGTIELPLMLPLMRIQRSCEHRVVPWANGLGVTAEVFAWPAGTDEWTWRLSIADVSDDLMFSVMPSIDRHILVAQGAGMALTIDGGAEQRMDRDTPPLAFGGESLTHCRLLDGPIADLNLMIRRGHAIGSLRVVSVRPARAILPSPGDVAIVVLDGSVVVDHAELTTFDALLLHDSPLHDSPLHESPLHVAFPTAGPTGARVTIANVDEGRTALATAHPV